MKLRFPLLLLVSSALAAATLGACGSDGGNTTTGMCGNGMLDMGEVCDGMFIGSATCAGSTMGSKPLGMIVCTPQCTLNLNGCYSQMMASGGVTGGAGVPAMPSAGGAPTMMMPTGTGGMMMGAGGTLGTGGMDPGTGGGPDGNGGDMSGGGTGGGP